MGCSTCGKNKRTGAKYAVTFKDGTTKIYSSEADARMAVVKRGGSYKRV